LLRQARLGDKAGLRGAGANVELRLNEHAVDARADRRENAGRKDRFRQREAGPSAANE
jgi:hypothetical protein